MMWVYRLLDILVTLSQVAIAFSAIDILCKNPRSKFYRWIPPVVLALVAYFWTWIIEDGSFKMPTLLIVLIASCIACYRDSIRNIIVAALMGMVFMAVSESVVYLFLEPFVDPMTVNINGFALPAIPVYLGCFFLVLSYQWAYIFCFIIIATNLQNVILQLCFPLKWRFFYCSAPAFLNM